ncbi:hypothetical protein [Sinomonas flava]|uniref:hypothetical protein n=1 Tax=Sinomonas flava TaxID=496857 RepID=UPI0039A4FCA3
MEKSLPLRHGLGHATAASLVAAAAVVLASGYGLMSGAGRYAQSQSVLVSQGADAANLIAVLLVVVTVGMAWRRSLTALLLWPGGLFYLAYAYVPYLVGAPFTPLLLVDVVAFLAAAYGLTALATAIDGTALRGLFSGAPARAVGMVLTVIGALAYAGLVATAIGAFGTSTTEAAWRGHWVADWILGTPALITGGVLLWAKRPFGYAAAPAMLLVSALGGAVFAVAAVVDNLAGGIRTDLSVVVVHLVISAVSLAVLAWFIVAPHRAVTKVRRPRPHPGPAPGTA